jgi:hypothetical protein
MVLYEILSNVASTDLGLRDYPACLDLADTFRALGVQVKFLRQVHQERDEINVAAGQFGQGVRAVGTAVKVLRPETHIKGVSAWVRAILGRPDRGLHLQVSQIRSTNACPLALGMIFRRGHQAFISGIEPAQLVRLCVAPDPTLSAIPEALTRQQPVLDEYLSRRQRPSGFFAQVQEVANLEFIDAALRHKLSEMVRNRDTNALAALTEAEVVNIGLLSEFIDRYQSVFEQYVGLVRQAELAVEMASFFDLLTHGAPFDELRAALEPFTPEETRSRIADKRSLVNELRIGLSKAGEGRQAQFVVQLRSVALKQRIVQDPALYAKAILLPPSRVEDVEVLSPLRDMYAALRQSVDAVRDALPATPQAAPQPLKAMLFEVLVRLTFDAQFSSKQDENRLPPAAQTARRLLEGVKLSIYDVANLRKLNPKLPPRGVAGSLAERVPIGWADLETVLNQLAVRLFPLGTLAQKMARAIQTRLRAQVEQRKAEAVRQYLVRGGVLIGLTNFVLGRAKLTGEEWASLFEAGVVLGLPMLASRDQIRNATALKQIQSGLNERLEGYVLLLAKEQQVLNPVQAEPTILASAYALVFEAQVVRAVKRFFFQKVQILTKQYGKEMFEVMYRHVVRQAGLPVSRNQLGAVLLRHQVFDPTRLRELGYTAGATANGDEGENPWLLAPGSEALTEGGKHPFEAGNVAAHYAGSLKAFREQLAGYAAAAKGQRTLENALAALARDDVFDPRRPAARELLGQTNAAAQLWKFIQQVISQNFKTILASAASAQEAIDLVLPGELANLAWLKPTHSFKAGEHSLLFRLVPDPDATLESLEAGPAAVAQGLAAQVLNGGAGSVLGRALKTLNTHIEGWEKLRWVSMVPVVDQILRETLLKTVRPAPPTPLEVIKVPEEQVLCVGVSSADQARFHRMVAHPERDDVYATLSELASWLARFPRLEAEMDDYRALIDEILGVVGGMNFTVWDAPYLIKYQEELTKLRTGLETRPEHLTLRDLAKIEEQARALSEMVRDIHTQEQALRPRDRWLNRIVVRLRAIRPDAALVFVDRLWEGAEQAAHPKPGEDEGPRKEKKEREFQTFSERVRNVIATREHLEGKHVFVLSPANTQRALTMNLIDRLFSLKGLDTPILVDIASCEAIVPALRTRLPPHRLFNQNEL